MNNKNENNYEFEPQKLKSKKGVITFVIVFLTIFLIGVCFITFKYLLPKDNDVNQDNNQSANSYKLDIYSTSSGSYCSEKSDYCNTLAFTIKTETKDTKVLDIDDMVILYKDNGTKIYDLKTKEIKKLNLEDTYNSYEILEDKDSNPIGITYQSKDSDYVSYYNLTTNKKMYENKYTDIQEDKYKYIEDDFIQDDYLYATIVKDSKMQAFLLNKDEEKIEFETAIEENNEEFITMNFLFYKVKDKYFYEVIHYDTPIRLYSCKKQLLAENFGYDYYTFYEDYLYVIDNNVLKKYDVDGNVITTVNVNKDKALQIINNHLIYIDDSNYLSIMNIDNTKENKQIVKFDENKYHYSTVSQYYSKEQLAAYDNASKEVGYYLQLFYKDDKADSNGYYGIEYCYTDDGKIITYNIEQPEPGRAKPVLYLYPTKETKVKVEFEHPEYLTTTYPKYQDKWEVIAKPNGDLLDKDNKYYYALYWDETRYHEVDFKEGFYVTKDNAINFLEDKLNIIGLNSREANEFIMYFLPILENNEKSLVYFELTKEREQHNKLIITPKPNSLLRVTIHIKKIDKETSIKEEKLETFKRVGFSAVEWGGMFY